MDVTHMHTDNIIQCRHQTPFKSVCTKVADVLLRCIAITNQREFININNLQMSFNSTRHMRVTYTQRPLDLLASPPNVLHSSAWQIITTIRYSNIR
jgi:hypothetical protein